MPNIPKIPDIPQYLWPTVVPTNMPIFNNAPAFNPAPITYGVGNNLNDESTVNKNKVSGHFGDGLFITWYADTISTFMASFNKVAPNGIQTFSNAELDALAAEMNKATGKYLVTDFEPAQVADSEWMWQYSHFNFQNRIEYLENKMKNTYNKVYYDWISARTKFTLNGSNYSIDGESNDGFANNPYQSSNTVEKILEVHQNPSAVTNLSGPLTVQCGLGYTAITYNAGSRAGSPLPNTKFQGTQNAVLRSLDNLALKHILWPTKSVVGYFWFVEDKPVGSNGAPGRRSNIYTKFKPNSTVAISYYNASLQQTVSFPQAQNLSGKLKYNDNRLPYPPNIVEDIIQIYCTYPNVVHNEYWKVGGSYNPYSQFRYTRVNNETRTCEGGENSFHTGVYTGSESFIACPPPSFGDYIGTENRVFTAFIKGHQKYSLYLKPILTGNQIQEYYQFQYKRFGSTTFTSAVFANHTGQAALAWKHEQPLLIVWRNPVNNNRVIMFWDVFADAYAPTDFKFTINSVEYTGTTKGNRLFTGIIGDAANTTISNTTSNLLPCNQGPTILSINNITNTGLTFEFHGDNVLSLTWRIKSGNTVIATNSANPSSRFVNITYNSINTGNYILEVQGLSCSSVVSSQAFAIAGEITPSKELIFVVNLTGNAFDFGNSTEAAANNYISNNQVQLVTAALTGENASVVDSIRMPFIWGDYNPSAGVYNDTKLSTAINWVRSLRPSNPPKIDLLIVPILGKPNGNFDTRIPANERAVDNNGNEQDCTYVFNTVPSYYSNAMTSVLNTGYDHLFPYLVANHGSHIRVIEAAAGQSEEHYMPFTANNPTSGQACGNAYSGIGDYSNASKLAWRTWLNTRYPGGANIPYTINGTTYTAANAELPNVGVTVGNNNNMDYSQAAYRDLFRFYSQGIFDVWYRFHQKVKQHSTFKTGYVVADLINEQGTKWIFHGGTIFLAMKYADQFYHTYNISPSEWYANLWGTDILLGTFPNSGKLSAIEYDAYDLGVQGGGSPNTAHAKSSILRFIKNGGKVVHTAMNWTTPQVTGWKQLIADIKTNYINNSSWTLENRTGIPTVNVDTSQLFNTARIYDNAWLSLGSAANHVTSNPQAYDATPMNIVILNNGTVDRFFQ